MAENTTRPKIGLVLGSEGIKSFSAMPLLEYFSKEDIEVDLVVGVSGGAFLAALWGAGYNLGQIEKLFAKAVDRKFYNQPDYKSLLNIANAGLGDFNIHSGLFKPGGIKRTYNKLFQNMRVENLKYATRIVCTDVESGQAVILDNGPLPEVVYASGANYPLMPPGKVGDRWLIDGALSSPLPIMEAVKQGMDVIVAVYFNDAVSQKPSGFIECFSNTIKIYKNAILRNQIPLSIDMHHYEIVPMEIRHPNALEVWEVDRLPEIMHAGKVALSDNAARIEGIIKNFKPIQAPDKSAPSPSPILKKTPAAKKKNGEEVISTAPRTTIKYVNPKR